MLAQPTLNSSFNPFIGARETNRPYSIDFGVSGWETPTGLPATPAQVWAFPSSTPLVLQNGAFVVPAVMTLAGRWNWYPGRR